MKHFLLSLIMLTCALTASAQHLLDDMRRNVPGQGTVTITQSQEIEKLVRQNPVVEKPKVEVDDNTVATENNPAVTEKKDEPNAADAKKAEAAKKEKARKESKELYRVQVFSGGNSRTDREQCEKTASKVKGSLSDMPVYVQFHSPRWVCRVGNFKTREDAQRAVTRLRSKGFRQASIVRLK